MVRTEGKFQFLVEKACAISNTYVCAKHITEEHILYPHKDHTQPGMLFFRRLRQQAEN